MYIGSCSIYVLITGYALLLLCWMGCTVCNAVTVDDLASNLKVNYENEGYLPEGPTFTEGDKYRGRITLTNENSSDMDSSNQNINIYSCFIR